MLAARADGDVDETLCVSFAHQKSKISGDARQGVRRPAPRNRLFAQRNSSDSPLFRRRTLFSSDLSVGASAVRSVPDPPSAKPTRVAVDETAVKINGEWSWLYAAIDVDTKLLLDVELFSRRGTNPAAAFLHRLREKHDRSETVFLVDQFGCRTALSRLGLNGRVDYVDRNIIETWFHRLTMRVDRFHNSWVGGRSSVRRWLVQFVHYYNVQRPHQSLDGRTPAEGIN